MSNNRSNINLIGNTTEGHNLGSGICIFKNKTNGNTLNFKSLKSTGSTISITEDADHIYFSASSSGGGTNYWSSGSTGIYPTNSENIVLTNFEEICFGNNLFLSGCGSDATGEIMMRTSDLTYCWQFNKRFFGRSVNGDFQINAYPFCTGTDNVSYGFTAEPNSGLGQEYDSGQTATVTFLKDNGCRHLYMHDNDIYVESDDIYLKSLPAKTSETNVLYVDLTGKISSGATSGDGSDFGWSNLSSGSTVAGCGTPVSSSTISGNTIYGVCAGANATTGCYNNAIGYKALYANTTGSNNIANGSQALYNNIGGCNNIANGYMALYCNTSGCDNIANGYYALNANTSGNYNIANGYQTLYCNTTGCNNIANGKSALYSNTTGSNNIANGFAGLISNTTGCDNIANGYQALVSNTTGCDNIANGYQTLYCNTSGSHNIANGCGSLYNNANGCSNIGNGYQTLYENTSGSHNIANGYIALHNNTTGCDNIANGHQTLNANVCGCNNIANGYAALNANTCGCDNIANGYETLSKNESGSYNIGIGHKAGFSGITGSSNIFIGMCAGYNETGSNKLYIANNASSFLIKGDFSDCTICNGKNTTTWDTTSDCRIKENIKEISGATQTLSQLSPKVFDFTCDYAIERGWDEKQRICNYNFIAQEYEKVFPKYVKCSDQEINGTIIEDFRTINTGQLQFFIVKAIQELDSRLKIIENQLGI